MRISPQEPVFLTEVSKVVAKREQSGGTPDLEINSLHTAISHSTYNFVRRLGTDGGFDVNLPRSYTPMSGGCKDQTLTAGRICNCSLCQLAYWFCMGNFWV